MRISFSHTTFISQNLLARLHPATNSFAPTYGTNELLKMLVMMLTCPGRYTSFCPSRSIVRVNGRRFPQLFAFLSHYRGGLLGTFSVVSGERNSPISLLTSAEDFRGKLANGADADRSRPLIRGCAGTASDWLATQCEA